jgi:hypothetical protein
MALRTFWAAVFFLTCTLAQAAEPSADQARLRAAVERSLPLLAKAAAGHRENRECFACHQQGLPVLALTAAKAKGFKIDEAELSRQIDHTVKFLEKNRDNYLQGKGQGGQADTAGYALFTLAAAGWQRDPTTAAVAEYLVQRHQDKDHWLNTSTRPPTEASQFTTTFVALRGLAVYGTLDERVAKRHDQVRKWLVETTPQDNEDRVFRLLALKEVAADDEAVASAAKELLARQREDGGWAQLDAGEPEWATQSDAYATATALVALHLAGGTATGDPAWQRGLAYLLAAQLPDGSWHVRSRSKPFQAYFESGFPHEKDQFISCAASAWATWALVLACEVPPGEREASASR